MPKIKNILIFTAIGVIFVLIYIYFIKPSSPTADLVSSFPTETAESAAPLESSDTNSLVAEEFLTLLLNVKNIKLDDAIFSDKAFNSLRDSSITLTPDGNEGRPNPFAPIGTDIFTLPVNTENTNTTETTTLP